MTKLFLVWDGLSEVVLPESDSIMHMDLCPIPPPPKNDVDRKNKVADALWVTIPTKTNELDNC